jgi:hypothetical protein
MTRKQRLYEALRRRGGIVADQAEWRSLGRACGYTAYRDLAGFFGGRNPSMVRQPDGSRELTAAGWLRARRV